MTISIRGARILLIHCNVNSRPNPDARYSRLLNVIIKSTHKTVMKWAKTIEAQQAQWNYPVFNWLASPVSFL